MTRKLRGGRSRLNQVNRFSSFWCGFFWCFSKFSFLKCFYQDRSNSNLQFVQNVHVEKQFENFLLWSPGLVFNLASSPTSFRFSSLRTPQQKLRVQLWGKRSLFVGHRMLWLHACFSCKSWLHAVCFAQVCTNQSRNKLVET